MKMTQTVKCSTFQGFAHHKADQDLTAILSEIENGQHRALVSKIRQKMQAGDDIGAGHVKRQLKPATLSARYTHRRIPEKIAGYNDVVMLDFDKLPPAVLTKCRTIIQAEPSTLFCFLSPSGNGLKAGVYLLTPQAIELRKRSLATDSIKFEELEKYHKAMFDLAKTYYETICGVEIDASGSDIGRLFFLSHDPEIYINHPAIQAVVIPALRIVPPPTQPLGKRSQIKKELPGNPEVPCDHIPLPVQMNFMHCMKQVERSITFTLGNRSTFLFTLANRCYRKGLPLVAVKTMVQKYYATPDMDVTVPVEDAYQYKNRTDEQEKENKKPVTRRVAEYVKAHYDIRRNSVMNRLEFRRINDPNPHVPLKQQHYNTIYCELDAGGIKCSTTTVKSVINSAYATEVNPFEDYFYNLPPWDGKTDYILELADTVQTTNQPFWRDCFCRWLTGLVACALDEAVVNQLALVIQGKQGSGKSTWIRKLLPPQLKLHYRNGMIRPDKTDDVIAMTTCLIMNLEEFEGMKKQEIGELKRMITQESVMERKVYETDHDLFIRRASFIASTNESRFLRDISGSRRFPTVTATAIDYKKPVNHAGIYSQALALWKDGFHYWYENEEIEWLNRQNQEYTLSIPEEELLYAFFGKPLDTDYEGVRWLSASEIMSQLVIYGKIYHNPKSLHMLTNLLERDGFEKRKSDQGFYQYKVKWILNAELR